LFSEEYFIFSDLNKDIIFSANSGIQNKPLTITAYRYYYFSVSFHGYKNQSSKSPTVIRGWKFISTKEDNNDKSK